MADEQVQQTQEQPVANTDLESDGPRIPDEIKQKWQEFDRKLEAEQSDSPVETQEEDDKAETPKPEAKEPKEPEKPEKKEEPTPSQGEGEELPEPEWDKSILEAAAKVGWTEDAAKRAFASPDALLYAIGLMSRQAQQQAPEPKPTEQQPAQPPATTKQPSPMPSELAYKLELDEETADPDVVKNVKGMNEHYAKVFEGIRTENSVQLAALQATVQQMVDMARQREVVELERQFDDCIARLGDEYAEFLGKGRTQDLPQNSDELKARVQIGQVLSTMGSVQIPGGRQLPLDRLVRAAVNVVLGDKATDIARARVRQQLRDAKGRYTTTQSPTHRNGKSSQLTGIDAAVALSERFDREHGVGGASDW